MILSNQARCRVCGDSPYSTHRHDYSQCECGSMAVDGGMDYLRRVGEFDELSIVVDTVIVERMIEAITDPSRNALGHICSVARIIRDQLGINIGEVKCNS